LGVDFSTLVYLPNYDLFGRDVSITPSVSQGSGAAAYWARGIWDSRTINVPLDDNSFLTDQDTILDIRTREFATPPVQGDHVHIPADGAVPAEGDFEIVNVWDNGGGEITLQLRAIKTAP